MYRFVLDVVANNEQCNFATLCADDVTNVAVHWWICWRNSKDYRSAVDSRQSFKQVSELLLWNHRSWWCGMFCLCKMLFVESKWIWFTLHIFWAANSFKTSTTVHCTLIRQILQTLPSYLLFSSRVFVTLTEYYLAAVMSLCFWLYCITQFSAVLCCVFWSVYSSLPLYWYRSLIDALFDLISHCFYSWINHQLPWSNSYESYGCMLCTVAKHW